MKTYTVKITETNVACMLIDAPDGGSAEDIAREMYENNGLDDYIAEHISMDEGGVEFEVVNESED